jgi:hypothetical protein
LATSSSISGTAAAEQGNAAVAAITAVPGRKLSVLPIGLGVFAGISVIALVVVGLVTYERTKYRKVCPFLSFVKVWIEHMGLSVLQAFRQRRLAELAAEMGYGGNALWGSRRLKNFWREEFSRF